VVFDQPLAAPAPGSFNPGTFIVRLAPGIHTTVTVAVSGGGAQVATIPGAGPYAGPPVVDYDASLQTIRGTTGTPAVSFSNLPCSIII
jgi:hypothetical protein